MKTSKLIKMMIPAAGLLVAVIAVWIVLGSSQAVSQNEKQPPRKIKVEVVEVQPTTIRDVQVLPGETKPWQDVLVSADQTGKIESLKIKEGAVVGKGDLIAEIDVKFLKAVLDNAEADFRMADQNYQRRVALYERKIISREEMDQYRTQKEVKEGMVRQAQANYDHAFIRSPIDGVVNHLYVDEGEFVATGAPVVELVNVDKIEINLNVPELDVRYLGVGQQVMIRVDAFPEEPVIGIIDFVSSKAETTTKTFATKIIMDNPDRKVRAGMIARVALQRRTIPDALVAPLFAIVDKGGERLVFVEKDGLARSRNISIGIIDGDRIQITKGLEPGDQLIVVGHRDVEEGTPVEVTKKMSTAEYLPAKAKDWMMKQLSVLPR